MAMAKSRFFYLKFDNLCHITLSTSRYNHNLNVKNMDFAEQEVEIRTCGQLYEKWRKGKKFRTIHKTDLKFRVPYVDTHSGAPNNISAPVVVALHGAPGSYKDFSSLISYLYHCGARVVAPSFPDFRTLKPGIFRHSAEEKAQYVKDFLKAITVHQVDVLVCHSSSVYPGLHLCLENENLNVKSLAMLNPGGISFRMKATRSFKALKFGAQLIEYPFLLKTLEYVGPFILKNFVKTVVRSDNFLDPMLSATTMVHADILKTAEKFSLLLDRKFPMLYIFSENDVLIGNVAAYELAHLLGIHDSDIYYYDEKGILKYEGKPDPKLRVMSFEKGSHYVFWKHPHVVNQIIADFMKEQKRIQD